jgi:hypothetical protein
VAHGAPSWAVTLLQAPLTEQAPQLTRAAMGFSLGCLMGSQDELPRTDAEFAESRLTTPDRRHKERKGGVNATIRIPAKATQVIVITSDFPDHNICAQYFTIWLAAYCQNSRVWASYDASMSPSGITSSHASFHPCAG